MPERGLDSFPWRVWNETLTIKTMPNINDNFLKLQAGYLFPEIGRRVNAFAESHPEAAKRLIRCEQTERARMLTTEMTDSLLISLLVTRCTVGGVSYDKK